jgi:hypothetical protein
MGIEITPAIKNSIKNYRMAGIDIKILGDNKVTITQARLLNGLVLTSEQLAERAREVFPDEAISIIAIPFGH